MSERRTLRGRIVRRETNRPCADSPEDIAAMIAASKLDPRQAAR